MVIKSFIESIGKELSRTVHIAPLIVYRIVFGFALAYSAIRMIVQDRIAFNYDTKVKFPFYGFEWIKPLPYDWYLPLFLLLAFCGIAICVGFFYRFFSIVHFVVFTYLELIDKSYYLNHYYFVSLMSFLHIFLPSGKFFSIDSWLFPKILVTHVPQWVVWIVKGQIAIVYVYAGLCKINSDWLLSAQPLKIWLPARDDIFVIGPLLRFEITAYVFSWLGMIYDITIPFWLSWKRTCYGAYLVVLIFHTITGLLFPIGIFPLVMSLGALVFFPEKFHVNFLKKLSFSKQNFTTQVNLNLSYFRLKSLKIFLGIYFIFQILFPWRYLLYPGRLFWHDQGFRFSWRVMLVEKFAHAQFMLVHPNGHVNYVDNAQFLKNWQEVQMSFQPDFIIQYAHFLADYYEPILGFRPQVKADVKIGVNGRPMTQYFSPNLDLTKINDGWQPRNWLYPAPW